MTGTIIENLSGRKLAILVSFLLLCQLTCFLIGLVAPMPANVQSILGTVCKDTTTVKNDTTKWFYNRGKGSCKNVNLGYTHHDLLETDIVFAFQMPLPRESKTLDYSRWQQNLIGVLQMDIKYHSQVEMPPRSTVTIDARLAYRNKGDPEDDWKLYTQSIEKRHLDCEIDIKSEEYLYNCSAIPLFELGSLFHDFYVLNVRLPVDTPTMNSHIRHIQDMWFKFLMLATLLCAALTVIDFMLGQVAEGRWKWDDNIELEYTSAFFTGVYGMWNIYIFALLVLYAPSHKRWPAVENASDTQNLSEEK
ncbi:unnamed protein product [Arctia plantaginis]|uniref:Wntless GOLD domain-containing protein n=1 Tax=Arctia plantaginis TaxID=874455 RepID=A0A8S0ZA42_ARCPL|nr:unnamed protein product [Arctia plantaginis]